MNALSCFPSTRNVISGVATRAQNVASAVRSFFGTQPVQQDIFVPATQAEQDSNTPSPAQVLSGVRAALTSITGALLAKQLHYEDGCDEVRQRIWGLQAEPKTLNTRLALKEQRAKLKRREARKRELAKAFQANLKLDAEINRALRRPVHNQGEIERLQHKAEKRIDQQAQAFHL